MDSFEFLKQSLCPNCSITVMEPHKELIDYLKCQVCGYCKKIELKNSFKIVGDMNDHVGRTE